MTTISTKLNAINTMLSVVGEPPINSLTEDAAKNADAVIAMNILDEVSREVQSSGWHFNSEDDVPLAPNAAGEIIIHNNVVRVDCKYPESTKYDLVLRGQKLYDKKKRTSVFTSTIKASVVSIHLFEDLPESVKRLVTIRAARMFQDRIVGSPQLNAFTIRDEQMAWMALREFEMDTSDRSIFDNYDVFRVVNRPSIR
jgi:hypothetical protein